MRLTEDEIIKSIGKEYRQAFLVEMNAKRKDKGTYMITWLLLGVLGGHRFYLGELGPGFGYLTLFFTSWLFFPGILLLACWVMDGVRAQERVDDINYTIAASIANRYKHGFETPTVV